VDPDPDEPSQETAHHHAPALQHGEILDDYGKVALVEVTKKEEAVILWSPAESISAPFSALFLLIRAVLKESRKRPIGIR
jgi:hypothetical protein